jgi:glycosyltransferase involved in cell wall biosynthesis
VSRERTPQPPPRVTADPPTIGIVTPSFQMAGFLRETIDSVLAQDWPHVDYLVMDGGSRDGTRDLLEGYGDRIRWVSEPDGGQADAVNRGFERTHGELFTFINADDVYRPGALRAAVEGFVRNPDAAAVYGDADFVDRNGDTVTPYPVRDFDRERLMHECFVCQPAAFVRRDTWAAVGGLDAELRYALDYDLWIRLSEHHRMARIPGTLATSRMHPDNKSLGERGGLYRESMAAARRHFGYVPMTWLEHYARHRVDRVDQFYAHSEPSRRSRAFALAAGLRYNARQPRRFWRDWQADGRTEPFGDGWMSKAYRAEHAAPAGATRLVVAGRHHAELRRPLLLSVSVDGRRVGRVVMRHNGAFEKSFPIPPEPRGRRCEVELVSVWTWRPRRRHDDARRLSCLLDRVAFE